MLTKGGYAMTFPLNMENSPGNLDTQPSASELAYIGSDSAKMNLRSVAYRYLTFTLFLGTYEKKVLRNQNVKYNVPQL